MCPETKVHSRGTAATAPQKEQTVKDNHFERWNLDRRFFYVWFWSWDNAFKNNSSGGCLAVCDDFGNLVPTHL